MGRRRRSSRSSRRDARERGLWNLFLPPIHEHGAGLTNAQYAPLAEITGRSPWIAPEALNCSAPDTGNMELLSLFGTPEQKARWLEPLLDGTIRSAFSMTEPDVASSDATNIATRIERDGDDYVINGRKWWTSGAMSPRCELLIVMGVTDPDAERHRRQSMILVPKDAAGVRIERSTSIFGYDDGPHGGHAEVVYDDVRVPATNLLGEEGDGFRLAQERLGPGRIHHAMRAIGMAERALEMMCRRTASRSAFGRPIIEHGVVQRWISEARVRIEQVRLLVLKTAWLMDTVGNRGARIEVSAIKVAAPEVATWVIDRAIQAYGGAGVAQDHLLPELYAVARILQIADGPDEVHHMAIARRETRRYREAVAASAWSPQWWPRLSLMSLKRSRSISITPTRVLSRCAWLSACWTRSRKSIRFGSPVRRVVEGLVGVQLRLLADLPRGAGDDPEQRGVEQREPDREHEVHLARVAPDRGRDRRVGEVELEGADRLRVGRVADRDVDLEQLAEALLADVLGLLGARHLRGDTPAERVAEVVLDLEAVADLLAVVRVDDLAEAVPDLDPDDLAAAVVDHRLERLVDGDHARVRQAALEVERGHRRLDAGLADQDGGAARLGEAAALDLALQDLREHEPEHDHGHDRDQREPPEEVQLGHPGPQAPVLRLWCSAHDARASAGSGRGLRVSTEPVSRRGRRAPVRRARPASRGA